jgi:hypothetical protein
VGEAVNLTFTDIDMEKRMVSLIDDTGKFDIQRYTFFTPEVKELLISWEKERIRLLEGKHVKSLYVRQMLEKEGFTIKMKPSHKEKNKDGKEVTRYKYVVYMDGKEVTKDQLLQLDNRLFPFCEKNAIAMWTSLIEKAGSPFNKRDTNPKFKKSRYMYNQHCLRRFWYTQVSSSRFNIEFMNFIGGHMSELDSSYIRYLDNPMWIDKIKKEYDNHMNCLSIFEAVPDLSGVHEELQEKDQRINDLERTMQELKAQVIEMRLERIEKANGIKKK